MCGIVGVAGNTYTREMKVFRDMLLFDVVRGFDSTGVALLPTVSNEPQVEKVVGVPTNLWDNDSKFLDKRGVANTPKRVAIGHNRAATVGEVTVSNAHPFTFDHITGVHNGSLEDWWELEKDEDKQRFDVDSKAIFKTIAEHGIEATWKKFIGAAALVWWDADKGTLNFARNEERPLYMAWSEKRDVLFWASEEGMIKLAAERNAVKLATFTSVYKDKDGNEVTRPYQTFSMRTHHHFEYKVTATSVELVGDRELEKKVAPKVTVIYGQGRGATHGTGYKQVSRPTVNYEDSYKLNSDWAKDYERADKGMRDLPFIVERLVNRYTAKGYEPFYVAKILNDEEDRLEIFPQTMGDLRAFEEENTFKGNIYTLDARPRIQRNSNGQIWSYRISLDHVSLVKEADANRKVSGKVTSELMKNIVRGFNENLSNMSDVEDGAEGPKYKIHQDKMVSMKEWEHQVHLAGGNCCFCGMPPKKEEANDCTWPSNLAIVCAGCTRDGSYQLYVESMEK